MISIQRLPTRPMGLFALSTITTLAGLAMRSCHPASEMLLIPMCSGHNLAIEAGGNAVLHCAGCYAALAGIIAMAASSTWAYAKRSA